jgi:hypothetical protein
MKYSTKHHQITKKRREAQVKQLLAWVSALTSLLTLVKLIVEIIKMLH